MIYTVGNEVAYDQGLEKYGAEFLKTGRSRNYAGGFACQTPQDAAKLLVEFDQVGEWAVYEVDADWEKDTIQSDNGWWHALLRDAVIVRKVVL